MKLYELDDSQKRSIAKETLETLEYWLRRFIHDELTKALGVDYLDYKKENGDPLISTKIIKKVKQRKETEPSRYPRVIDATLLEHQIDIICNLDLYNKYFHAGLSTAFPNGREQARTTLKQLEYPRNCLAHANPLSTRDCEKVVCYSHDVIDSLKKYYTSLSKDSEFNVPQMIRGIDHFGNVFNLTEITSYNFCGDKRFNLWPGDILTVEVEVDETYDASEYELWWYGIHVSEKNIKKLTLRIEDKHVSQCFQINCKLTSNKSWHK
ncbi:MAG TPA: hypothetical protein VGK47_11520, partial [Nitrososphaeraceae archaeon]